MSNSMATGWFITRLLLWIMMLITLGCQTKETPPTNETRPEFYTIGPDLSANFTIDIYPNVKERHAYKVLTVKTPWEKASASFQYVLYPRGTNKPPAPSPDATFVETPVRSLVCTSTTHVAFLDALGKLERIKGIAGTKYVYNPTVQDMITEGQIKEVGLKNDLNYEQIVALQPDVVLTYGISADNNIDKLKEAGLTPVVIAEFMDNTPLGRLEWMRFIGELFEKSSESKTLFEEEKSRYESAARLVKGVKAPTVMVGMGFKGTWYVPGAQSYVAQAIKDAGGDYLWKDQAGKLSLALDFEAVFSKSKTADKWINVGMVFSLGDIKAADSRYTLFQSWQQGEVYNGTARVSESGGYDIYESAVVRPYLVLKDLIKAFHPELMPDHDFYFYEKLD